MLSLSPPCIREKSVGGAALYSVPGPSECKCTCPIVHCNGFKADVEFFPSSNSPSPGAPPALPDSSPAPTPGLHPAVRRVVAEIALTFFGSSSVFLRSATMVGPALVNYIVPLPPAAWSRIPVLYLLVPRVEPEDLLPVMM